MFIVTMGWLIRAIVMRKLEVIAEVVFCTYRPALRSLVDGKGLHVHLDPVVATERNVI